MTEIKRYKSAIRIRIRIQTQLAPTISSVILSGGSILPTMVLLCKILSQDQSVSAHICQEVISWMAAKFGRI